MLLNHRSFITSTWYCLLFFRECMGSLGWWINIGSGNGLVPDGTKPLPDPMSTNFQDIKWHHPETISWLFFICIISQYACSIELIGNLFWKLLDKNIFQILSVTLMVLVQWWYEWHDFLNGITLNISLCCQVIRYLQVLETMERLLNF